MFQILCLWARFRVARCNLLLATGIRWFFILLPFVENVHELFGQPLLYRPVAIGMPFRFAKVTGAMVPDKICQYVSIDYEIHVLELVLAEITDVGCCTTATP